MQHQDLLQLLIDARDDTSTAEDEEARHAVNDSYKRKLTSIEIVRTSVALLLAGKL